MRRSLATAGFGLSVIVMLAVQVFFLARKIEPVDGAVYARYGIELASTAKWRYGYVAGMHGAVLVKVPITEPGARRTAEPTELKRLMAAELAGIPLRFTLETTFYAFLLVYVFFLAPRLAAALRNRGGRRFRGFLARLLPGALFFVFAAAPLLIWGYGYGGFTNLVGPDAMSYSGPYFHWRSWLGNSSNSISYRAFVSPLVLPAGMFVELLWEGLHALPLLGELYESEPASNAPYWVAGAFLYGLFGLALRRIFATPRPRPTPA